MKTFSDGLNNFWVGLVCGMLMPLVLVVGLLYLTVDKLTGVVQDSAISPFLERSEQTLDKVDKLLVTLDDKVDSASLKDLNLLAPLKNAQIMPELQALASAVTELKQAADNIDREAVLLGLQQRLEASLAQKFPEQKARALAQNLRQFAELLAKEQQPLETLGSLADKHAD